MLAPTPLNPPPAPGTKPPRQPPDGKAAPPPPPPGPNPSPAVAPVLPLGPPRPPSIPRGPLTPAVRALPPPAEPLPGELPPLTSSRPPMTTSPVARMTTGVLAVFLRNATVTPTGMLTEVKLKIPLGGRVTVVLTAGLKAPSAPVLPLTKADAAGAKHAPKTNVAMALIYVFMIALLRFRVSPAGSQRRASHGFGGGFLLPSRTPGQVPHPVCRHGT